MIGSRTSGDARGPVPRHACAMRRRLLATLLLVATCAQAHAASSSSSSGRRNRDFNLGRNTLSRRTAGGGDFPTWEREVSADERNPLPQGPPGRYVPAWTLELGSRPVGAASLGGAGILVALADGGMRIVGADGVVTKEIAGEGEIALPPIASGGLALVVAGGRLLGVTKDGIAWRSEAQPPIVRGPAAGDACAFVVREGGRLDRVSTDDGSTAWSASVDGEVRAGPSASARRVAVGVAGDVIAFDAVSGAPAWRKTLGDRVDSVLVTPQAVHVSGIGHAARTKGTAAPIVGGLTLRRRDGQAQGDFWRLRVGGACRAQPLTLDDLVAFTCADGYVRAVERDKGVGGWRTDLPAVADVAPVLTGSRLEIVIPNSSNAVSLAMENGAVLGWVTLPDEDETFVGTAAVGAGITAACTSFSRLIGWRWEWESAEGGGKDRHESHLRPGEEDQDSQRRGPTTAPYRP